MTTINDLAREWNVQPYEVAAFGDLGTYRQDKDLDPGVEATIREAWAMGPDGYGTPEAPVYRTFREDGSEVMPGDTLIDFRGDSAIFKGCTHARKVNTDRLGVTSYPSVFNVEIRGPEGYVWNPVSDEGRRLQGASQ